MLTQDDHDHLNCPACGGSGHIEDATYAAVRNLLAERRRCISVEGWTPEHDDEHGPAILAEAAGCYAYWSADGERLPNMVPHEWPWDDDWWKPGKQYRMLEKAGQLILAAMECLDRASGNAAGIAEAKIAETPLTPQELAEVRAKFGSGWSDEDDEAVTTFRWEDNPAQARAALARARSLAMARWVTAESTREGSNPKGECPPLG